MVEGDQKITEKAKGMVGTKVGQTWSVIKLGINKVGIPVGGKKRTTKFTEIPAEVDAPKMLEILKSENLIQIMGELNGQTTQIERTYWNQTFEDYFDKIAELYEIIGPYQSPGLAKYERDILGFGMMKKPTEKMFSTDEIFNYTDKVRVAAFGKVFSMPIPKEVRIEHPSGLTHHLRVWGEYYPEKYRDFYKRLVEEICEQARKYYVKALSDDILKDLQNENRKLKEELESKKKRLEELNKRKKLKDDEKKEKDALPDEIKSLEEQISIDEDNIENIRKGEIDSVNIRKLARKEEEKGAGNLLQRMFTHIDNRKKAFSDIMVTVFDTIKKHEFDFRHKTYDPMQDAFDNLLPSIQKFLKENKPSVTGRIYCVHSYRVIYRNEYIDDKGEKRELGDSGGADAFKSWDWEKKKKGEKASGLDHIGMGLEVGDAEQGNPRVVLSDMWLRELYENKKRRGKRDLPKHPEYVRKLTEEEYEKCTTYLDWMEIYMAMHNEWDRLRDDTRDGRYHNYSLTAYDYVLAAEEKEVTVVKSVGEDGKVKEAQKIHLTEDMLEPNKIGFTPGNTNEYLESQKKVDMYRSYVMDLYKGNEVINKVGGIRKGYHLSPVFDKRAFKIIDEWKHAGVIFWYGTPDDVDCDILPDELQPHISSRGICLYLIDKVMRNMKYIKDIHHVLINLVGPHTGGFDYGPRIYATDMPKDPFNVEGEKVAVAIKGDIDKLTAEELRTEAREG